jgi:hypothetical protein
MALSEDLRRHADALQRFIPCGAMAGRWVLRQHPETGDVILSRRPADRDDFFAALRGARVPADFLDEKGRNPGTQDRGPFEGWNEERSGTCLTPIRGATYSRDIQTSPGAW